ncbi:MAG: hypothetical protein ACRDGA_07575 [Bacteroidota bacterium]
MSEKERVYFEYIIENEPLLQDFITLLVDGDAYPAEYSSKATGQVHNNSLVQWGRVVRNIARTIQFERMDRDSVEATIATTLEGAVKMSAPYHLSRRKKHAVLFKPFKERCTQKAYFHRISNSSDLTSAWKLTGVSVGRGGTENAEVAIEELSVRTGNDASAQFRPPYDHIFRLNGNLDPTSLNTFFEPVALELKVSSKEMEQNMIGVRSLLDNDEVSRRQLAFQSDAPHSEDNYQAYFGEVGLGSVQGASSVVVEAVLRSSLYDTGTPISSSFLVFLIGNQ